MTEQYTSLQSLQEGHWFKLICGASFQHLPAIRNLALAYTLAGADCIDVAADPAVILAAQEAIAAAIALRDDYPFPSSPRTQRPLLMVSLNDGEDPHFRKAEFPAIACPTDCPRPCEQVCPAHAIVDEGVIADRCYGCGRCIPVCPIQNIYTRSYVTTAQAIAPLILDAGVDAIEIHTQPGRLADFQRLWQAIKPWIGSLKLLAISCPDGDGVIEYLQALYATIAPLPCPLIWQTDGRPMSGDIGAGTTKAAIQLGQDVLAAGLPGYVQLAGGTNHTTVAKLRSLNLLRSPSTAADPNHPDPNHPDQPNQRYIAGIAYGSYARVLLDPVLKQLEALSATPSPVFALPHGSPDPEPRSPAAIAHLERYPPLLTEAVRRAHQLIAPLKPPKPTMLPIPDF